MSRGCLEVAGKKRLSQTANKMREEIDGTWKPAKEKPDDGFWGGCWGRASKAYLVSKWTQNSKEIWTFF